MRLRDIKWLTQGHTAWKIRDLEVGLPAPESLFALPCSPHTDRINCDGGGVRFLLVCTKDRSSAVWNNSFLMICVDWEIGNCFVGSWPFWPLYFLSSSLLSSRLKPLGFRCVFSLNPCGAAGSLAHSLLLLQGKGALRELWRESHSGNSVTSRRIFATWLNIPLAARNFQGTLIGKTLWYIIAKWPFPNKS